MKLKNKDNVSYAKYRCNIRPSDLFIIGTVVIGFRNLPFQDTEGT